MSDEHEPPYQPDPPHPYRETYRAHEGQADIRSEPAQDGKTVYIVEIDGVWIGTFTSLRAAKKAADEALEEAMRRRRGPGRG